MNLYSAPLGTPPPGDEPKQTAYTMVSYDIENGELTTVEEMFGGITRDIVRVRVELQEKALRLAVIYELEKLGYTVLSPEPDEGDGEM